MNTPIFPSPNDAPPAKTPPGSVETKVRPRAAFRIGLVLLVANVPLGYGGIAAGVALAAATKNRIWLTVGFGLYALSWGMLGLGILLAGREGIEYLREKRRRWRMARRQNDE